MFMTNFQWDERPPAFEVADGEHRVKIVRVYDGSTQSGKACTNFVLQVEGGNVPYTHTIYFGNEYTNRNWTNFLAAFGITPPPVTDDWANYYGGWTGKYGKGMFRHKDDTYTGRDGIQRTVNKCEMHYFVVPPKQGGTVTAPQPQQAPVQTAKPAPAYPSESFPEDIPFNL